MQVICVKIRGPVFLWNQLCSQEAFGLNLNGRDGAGTQADSPLQLLIAHKHGDVPDSHTHE